MGFTVELAELLQVDDLMTFDGLALQDVKRPEMRSRTNRLPTQSKCLAQRPRHERGDVHSAFSKSNGYTQCASQAFFNRASQNLARNRLRLWPMSTGQSSSSMHSMNRLQQQYVVLGPSCRNQSPGRYTGESDQCRPAGIAESVASESQ